MKSSAKRTSALALALLMLLSAFVSCSESEVNTQETTAGEQTPTVSADPEAALKAFNDRQPMGRLGNPDEIAEAIVFAAKEEAGFMTGINLIIDGGVTL